MDEKTENKVYAIAADIPPNGFQWTVDGPKIAQIIAIIDADLQKRSIDEQSRQIEIKSYLDFLDTWYGWNPRNMSEEAERKFYDWMVETLVTE